MKLKNIFKTKKQAGIGEKKNILSNFILLAYGDTQNKRKTDLIGTAKDKTTFKIFSYDSQKQEFMCTHSYVHSAPIEVVIPCDYAGDGRLSYLLCCKNSHKFRNFIYFIDGTMVEIGESDVVPFLFTYENDLKPSILIQDNKSSDTQIIKINKDHTIKSEKTKNFGHLSSNHTSAFVDINGDLIADLVLIEEDGDFKAVNFYLNKQGSFVKHNEPIIIPKETGPILFADFGGSGCNDMVFVSKENEEFFINVLLNKRRKYCKQEDGKLCLDPDIIGKERDWGYEMKNYEFHKKYNLKTFFGDLEPVLISEEGFPTGIFVVDLNLNSFPDIILIMNNKSTGEKGFIRVLENTGDQNSTFKIPSYSEPLNNLKSVKSVSVGDFENKGREGLFINRYENGELYLDYYPNDISIDSLKITVVNISPYSPKTAYGTAVPGISYVYHVEEESIVRIGRQIPQSSFVHLQQPVVFFGLGTINLLIDKLFIGVPRTTINNGLYELKSKIIPNSDLVLRQADAKIGIELFLNLGDYVFNVILVLGGVLIINLIFVIYFYRKEKRRDKRARTQESMLFNFDAL